LRASAHLWRFWYIRGYLDEGRRRLRKVLAVTPEAKSFERAQALRGAGTLTQVAGDLAQAMPLCRQALQLYEHLDDKRGQSACLTTLGIYHLERGETRDARRHFERAAEIDRELDDTRGIAITLHNLANVAWVEGDPGEAKRLLKKSRKLSRPVIDKEGDALALANLAFLELATYDVAAGNAAIREGLGIVRELGGPEATMYALEAGAAVLAANDEHHLAAQLFGAAKRVREISGIALPAIETGVHQETVSKIRTHLSEAEFAAAFERGQAIGVSDLIEEALKRLDELILRSTLR
jgi:tetratricopeptide (TPR) repeat protein